MIHILYLALVGWALTRGWNSRPSQQRPAQQAHNVAPDASRSFPSTFESHAAVAVAIRNVPRVRRFVEKSLVTSLTSAQIRAGVIERLKGRVIIVDTNILMHSFGRYVARQVATTLCKDGTRIVIPRSQWREVLTGINHVDSAKAAAFSKALRMLRRFVDQGIADPQPASVQVTRPGRFHYADDEMIACLKGWVASGVRSAILTCDRELCNRVRKVAATGVPSQVLLINQTVLGAMRRENTLATSASSRA